MYYGEAKLKQFSPYRVLVEPGRSASVERCRELAELRVGRRYAGGIVVEKLSSASALVCVGMTEAPKMCGRCTENKRCPVPELIEQGRIAPLPVKGQLPLFGEVL